MKQVTSVIYNGTNVFVCGPIKLIPGANNLGRYSEEEVKAFLNNETVKKRIKQGAIEVRKKATSDDGQLPAKEAIELVKETLNRQELREMLKSETRPSVVKAINEQLELVKAEQKDEEEDEEKDQE